MKFPRLFDHFLRHASLFVAGMVMTIGLGWQQEAHAHCERTYLMAHSGDYVPYQYMSEDGVLIGLDVDILAGIMREMGCGYELKKLPPRRAQLMLREGEMDVMAAASITAERHQYAHFSLPYRDEKIVMFARVEDAPNYQTLDLKGAFAQNLTVAAGIGGWYGSEYGELKDTEAAKNSLVLNNSTRARIRQLITGRVQLVLADLYVGYYHAGELDARNRIIELPHALNADPVHFMLSRKTMSGSDVDSFNKALSRFMSSEQYTDLILEYRPRGLE
ncbi:amino acid ABC transporter substrate-binding protein (PAAT family) [Aestuariispira insulae]|uniref:Amino acid ABC transporter substrate-binding protein (PAAT family) n=2 Tax=Aestuariispira insulae TaxID=1461337 RepID=A0A3D9HZ66_9PROT|nr:amino acid ABC transporter substrate-binding protein (PAAT family) [Aestuariispira insulae]